MTLHTFFDNDQYNGVVNIRSTPIRVMISPCMPEDDGEFDEVGITSKLLVTFNLVFPRLIEKVKYEILLMKLCNLLMKDKEGFLCILPNM